MSTPDGKKVALVLSGGGANGAYEVGVLKALLAGKSPATDYQPLVPDIVSGTSIGAFNAAFLVSQWGEYGAAAAGNLETFWAERLAGSGIRPNGVFRVRGNVLDLADPYAYLPNPVLPLRRLLADGGFLAWEGLQRVVHLVAGSEGPIDRRLAALVDLSTFISLEPLEETLLALDYRAIRQSPLWLKVLSTNWADGTLRVFWNHDMTDSFGPLALRASAAVPGIFPPAVLGAQTFVDGSVLLNAPLAPAIHAGAEVLHVVYLDPDIRNIPLDRLPQSFGTFTRMLQIGWAAAYNDDIGDAARINRVLAAMSRARTALRVDEAGGELLLDIAEARPAAGRPALAPLEIRRYHPRDSLPGDLGFLNFDRDRIEELIERGFDDAVNHDSRQSGDVFPTPERAAAASQGDPIRQRFAAAGASSAPPARS
ncbi:MAG TPA: patatin-like phospholipase family protein [Thermoanaerobaculia bacterium]|nr:patatin-like phospholipase family protein [Thermoanaerobaculia bacterium]